MSITINGIGTITGLAVGGLPDGSVDSDTLAADVGVGGKILQVKQTTSEALTTVTDGTETEVLNCAITPSATSSKILITLTSAPAYVQSGSEFQLYLYRDSTHISGYAYYFGSGAAGSQGQANAGPNGMYLDSPNSTSAITYRVKITRRWGSGNVYYSHVPSNGNVHSSLTLMEVAA